MFKLKNKTEKTEKKERKFNSKIVFGIIAELIFVILDLIKNYYGG